MSFSASEIKKLLPQIARDIRKIMQSIAHSFDDFVILEEKEIRKIILDLLDELQRNKDLKFVSKYGITLERGDGTQWWRYRLTFVIECLKH